MFNKKVFLKLLICGIVAALPYVFEWLWPLSWVALIPFIYAVLEKGTEITRRKAYLWGFGFGLGYYLVMYHWFINFYPMEFAGITKGMAAMLVVVCWFGLATVQALEFGAVTLIYRLIKPNKDNQIICGLLITSLWVLFEWQQNFFWRGVPWARLSVTQTALPQLLQSASLFGNLFVSGLIVFVNALLCIALRCALARLSSFDIKLLIKAIKNKKTVILSAIAIGLFSVNLIYGCVRCAVFDDKSEKVVKAAVIQGNMSSLDKWAGMATTNSADLSIALTEECVRETGATLVVWPETVIPICPKIFWKMN